MIIARGAIQIRVRFVVGTRRRSRRAIVAHRTRVDGTPDDAAIRPWPVISSEFLAEHIAIAHALRRAAMRQMFLRLIGKTPFVPALGPGLGRPAQGQAPAGPQSQDIER